MGCPEPTAAKSDCSDFDWQAARYRNMGQLIWFYLQDELGINLFDFFKQDVQTGASFPAKHPSVLFYFRSHGRVCTEAADLHVGPTHLQEAGEWGDLWRCSHRGFGVFRSNPKRSRFGKWTPTLQIHLTWQRWESLSGNPPKLRGTWKKGGPRISWSASKPMGDLSSNAGSLVDG